MTGFGLREDRLDVERTINDVLFRRHGCFNLMELMDCRAERTAFDLMDHYWDVFYMGALWS